MSSNSYRGYKKVYITRAYGNLQDNIEIVHKKCNDDYCNAPVKINVYLSDSTEEQYAEICIFDTPIGFVFFGNLYYNEFINGTFKNVYIKREDENIIGAENVVIRSKMTAIIQLS